MLTEVLMKKTMAPGVLLVLVLLFTLSSCTTGGNTPSAQSPSPASSPSSAAPSSPSSAVPSPGGDAISICAADDKALFTLQHKGEGYDIIGGAGEKSGSIKVEKDRVKVKDNSGKVIWKLKKKENGCKVLDDRDQEVMKIKGSKGDCKIKDAHDNEIAKIKSKPGYLEITGGGRVKSESDAVLVYDGKQNLLYRIRGGVSKEEAAFLGLPGDDILQKIGMMVYFRDIR